MTNINRCDTETISTAQPNCRFSIITVSLNAAKTIEHTIKSVLSQTFPAYEYIIIDGGSTDGTRDIIERYRSHFSHVVFEPDNGIYDAFNKGVRLASGDVIGILNADDIYTPWALEKVAEARINHPEAGVLYGDVFVLDEEKTEVSTNIADHTKLHNSMICHQGVFVTHETYDKFGLYDTTFKIASDRDMLLRFMGKGVVFYNVDSFLAVYRAGGVSSQSYKLEIVRIYWRHLPFLKAFIKTFFYMSKIIIKSCINIIMGAVLGNLWVRLKRMRRLRLERKAMALSKTGKVSKTLDENFHGSIEDVLAFAQEK